ncbi:MAG: tyrosine-type recombinase/integrase [Bacteroidales bacterium]|nr:tyrosine-type recombinase/integrase [Bacteroidales bacterium]
MHIDTFFKYLKFEKRYSQNTIRAYSDDLNQFVQFIQNNTENFINNQIIDNHVIIRSWLIFLFKSNHSATTIRRKISSLRKYYKFLMQNNFINKNPLDKIISPKTNKNIPNFIKTEEIQNLFEIIEFKNNLQGARDRAILEILYNTGIRLSELINLKNTDIYFSSNTIKVVGKRNKERIIPYSESLNESITKYIIKKEENSFSSDFFILTNKGQKSYPKLIYRVVTKYLSRITTSENKNPHILRHTYATHLLNNGADLNAVKELLGHANLSATQIYTHNTFKKINKIYKLAHPRA